MPNLDAIQTWIEALQSGGYEQTSGILFDGFGGYCCLGVACDLYSKKKNLDFYEVTGHDVKTSAIPRAVAEWLGLAKEDTYLDTYVNVHFKSEYNKLDEYYAVPIDPVLDYADMVTDIAGFNDEGIEFEGIAQILIQEYLI